MIAFNITSTIEVEAKNIEEVCKKLGDGKYDDDLRRNTEIDLA